MKKRDLVNVCVFGCKYLFLFQIILFNQLDPADSCQKRAKQ